MGKVNRRLIPTKKLKSNILKEVAKRKRRVYLRYDSDVDTLMLMFISPDKETVVHYIDDNTALLYEPGSREIVGIQIEAFERSFLPQHTGVEQVWRFSEGTGIRDFGDVITKVETIQPIITQEILKASGSLLANAGLSQSLRDSLVSSNLVPA